SRRRHTRFSRDWSSDVCSSDLAAMSVIWGVPYLLIKVAVGELSPVVVVFGRCVIGAVPLLPWTVARGQLRPALRHWPWLLAFTRSEERRVGKECRSGWAAKR